MTMAAVNIARTEEVSKPSVAASIAGNPRVAARGAELLNQHQRETWQRIDRLFAGLLAFQWVGGIILTLCLSPRTWNGAQSQIHPHVWQAIFLGLAIIVAPIAFALLRPRYAFTRHLIAVAQMLSSALLIHLGGGRIEMHFHIFGSLAFLAFYRDWRVLVTATLVVAGDHLVRGLFFPESVFGIVAAGNWRWLEHAAWVIFEDVFLFTSCFQGVREMRVIADRQALLEYSYQTVEEKVNERTKQLKEVREELLNTARAAGKAEIATSVLHNVGNVLNSVNISVGVATSKLQESPVKNLALVVQAFEQHKTDLANYLTSDERGRQIPDYLATVSEVMAEEQAELLGEMTSLARHVEHIKQIVSVQQQNAKHTEIAQQVNIADLIQDAVQVNNVEGEEHQIEIVRQFEPLPSLLTDKHAILQIMINLISNAKHAILNSGRPTRRMQLKCSMVKTDDRDMVRIQVVDSGMGIEAANIRHIFTHGFTTKKEGHGFGLHGSANAAKQLRGSLTATSDGPGTGATFTLDLPMNSEVAAT